MDAVRAAGGRSPGDACTPAVSDCCTRRRRLTCGPPRASCSRAGAATVEGGRAAPSLESSRKGTPRCAPPGRSSAACWILCEDGGRSPGEIAACPGQPRPLLVCSSAAVVSPSASTSREAAPSPDNPLTTRRSRSHRRPRMSSRERDHRCGSRHLFRSHRRPTVQMCRQCT